MPGLVLALLIILLMVVQILPGYASLDECSIVPDEDCEDYWSWSEMSVEDEVMILYGGSWIKRAIYNDGQAYVRIRRPAHVYNSVFTSDDNIICTIDDTDMLLLATEHCVNGNTVNIRVQFEFGGEIIDGYVHEDDLVNQVFEYVQ